jgi:hypothetical protein
MCWTCLLPVGRTSLCCNPVGNMHMCVFMPCTCVCSWIAHVCVHGLHMQKPTSLAAGQAGNLHCLRGMLVSTHSAIEHVCKTRNAQACSCLAHVCVHALHMQKPTSLMATGQAATLHCLWAMGRASHTPWAPLWLQPHAATTLRTCAAP